MALVAASVCAFGGWLLETLVGHTHKVVPFIGWSALRARGIRQSPAGRQLMFADLYDHTWAAVAYGLVTAGIAALCIGLASSTPIATTLGGGLFVATGIVVAANLSSSPIHLLSGPIASTTRGADSGIEAKAIDNANSQSETHGTERGWD